MTTHVHKTTNIPMMSSIATRGYRSINAKDSKGGYRGPFVMTQGIS